MKWLALFILFGSSYKSTGGAAIVTNVYICVSSGSTVYHQERECRTLKNCIHTIKEVSENEAKGNYGRRKCKVCY